MKKETRKGYIVRGYDFFDFIEEIEGVEPDMEKYWERMFNRANLPYLTSYEKFYRPLEERTFYKATLTLDVSEGIGEPIMHHHYAQFEKNIVEMTDRKLSLLGWIVRVFNNDGTPSLLEFYLEHPGNGTHGWRCPIFGYGMFWHHMIWDLLGDDAPANKPVPCKMTIELI